MSDAAVLRDNVHQLSRVHAATLHTDDGPRIVKVDPLIAQLRAAIAPSGSSGNGGSPTKQRLPMNADAFDAYQIISEQAIRALTATARRPRRSTLEATIIRYQAAAQGHGATELADAAHLTGQWIRLTQSILNPSKARRPTQQPCPHCANTWDTTTTDRRWAVTVWAGDHVPITEWEAYCSACETAWVGEELAIYLRAMAAA